MEHQRIKCFSLIDITNTGTIGNYRNGNSVNLSTWNQTRNQQRNLETIIQVVNLRTQPLDMSKIVSAKEDLSLHKFGFRYTGSHMVWSFQFSIEHYGVLDSNGIPLKELTDSLNDAPCISKLNETIEIVNPVFKTDGELCNIYFLYI